MKNNFKVLPSVNEVLRQEGVAKLAEVYPRSIVTRVVRDVISEKREQMRSGINIERDTRIAMYEKNVKKRLDALENPSFKNVVNCTGIIINTNLGRSVLCEDSVYSLKKACGFSNLELDLGTGMRSSRNDHLRDKIRILTGAEDSIVVNNNAAAILLSLSTLAKKKEVLISRGEIVEIGGNFRMNEIMKASGAKIREVGTTNRTRLSDYKAAIGPGTGAILKINPSNYRIVGFSESTSLTLLARLGRERNIPVIYDAGSGLILPIKGLKGEEPLIGQVVKTGVDIVTFSADKLLGGPQAGIILGKNGIIERLNRNPLSRALRVCKLTVASLEATLRHYIRRDSSQTIPVIWMIERPVDEIEKSAVTLCDSLKSIDKKSVFNIEVKKGRSFIGGGSYPGESLETRIVSLKSKINPSKTASILRRFDTPIMARIEKNELLLDLRTILKHEIIIISKAFEFLLKNLMSETL